MGSVSSFNRILQFHFNLKKLQDRVVVVHFSLAAKFITPTSTDKVLDSISLTEKEIASQSVPFTVGCASQAMNPLIAFTCEDNSTEVWVIGTSYVPCTIITGGIPRHSLTGSKTSSAAG